MRPRAAAWAAGAALLVAAVVPALPAQAADPLPPCYPNPSGDPTQPLVAGVNPGDPPRIAIPQSPLLPQLPGVAYCDPSLPLPPGFTLPGLDLPPLPVPSLPELPQPIQGIVEEVTAPLAGVPDILVPPEPVPVPAVLDPDAPLFTQPSAQAASDSIQIEGLHSVDVVLVRTLDHGEIPAIRIIADAVTLGGFTLDVRPSADSPAAVNDSVTMAMNGNVRVYLNSLTATGPGGVGISLLAPTPPPGDELPPTLLRATFGLVGATADHSTWSQTYLRIVE